MKSLKLTLAVMAALATVTAAGAASAAHHPRCHPTRHHHCPTPHVVHHVAAQSGY